MLVLGLDLAGVEHRPTGVCVLRDNEVETMLVFRDCEIIKLVEETHPEVVAVDAPLSLPEGRVSLEQKTNVHLRGCDRELLKRGIRFFPITLGPMRKLTNRGMALREILEGRGYKVIEVYPGGAQDVWGIPRKQKGLKELRDGLAKKSVKGLSEKMSDHELDAVSCALVGRLFMDGKSVNYGAEKQVVVMPKGEKQLKH